MSNAVLDRSQLASSLQPHGELAVAKETIVPYRVVLGSILASLIWKWHFYWLSFQAYSAHQLQTDFFPPMLANVNVLVGLYLLSTISLVIAMFSKNVTLLRSQAALMLTCMFGLCIHQSSYNDVTFATCFWTSAWCVWYTLRISDAPDELRAKAKTFAVLIISMIFLGGAIGKLTPGYWSGQVLYEIYFVDRDFWVFNLLRSNFDPETLRPIATYYSRMVIITEFSCAFLWVLPVKLASSIAIAVLLGIALMSNALLFSVLTCLIGLAIYGLHEPKASKIPVFANG